MRGLKGKVVIIAGAATGIGAGTALRLAQEGARVVVGDINAEGATRTAARITAEGGDAIAVGFDISNDESVKALVQKTIDHFGGVDHAHINAAAMHLVLQDTNILDVSLDLFDTMVKVNMRGHVLCTRHILPHLLKKKAGALVYTSSEAAFGYSPEYPCYAMTKSAITALVRHVALQYGRDGIRANAVCPGVVITDEVRPKLSDQLLSNMLKPIPTPRLGTAEDIGGMVAMLMSDDSMYVNGQCISVNGGSILR